MWPRLKSFILEQNPSAGDQVLYMCNYCKPVIKKNKLPARCVLNGLQLDTIPPELAQLDSLSRQLIQRAKCYQTVVRLGTYTAKVPVYNSLKACKGTMFFLPLPLRKTLETLDQVKHTSDAKLALPNPELYIIVNGRPTKSKVVWRTLVDVNAVKTAIKRLREINWLYREVHDESVDEAAKQVIEVTKNTSSTMLEKASDNDLRDQQLWKVFVSMTLWLTMIGKAEMMMVIGSTENSQNLDFLTTSSLILPMNYIEKTTVEKIAKKSLSFKLGCAASVNIWRDSVVYDELTINERQKNDKEFSSMLDCVRRGRPTDETLCTLQERVIQVSVSDKFDELQKAGQTPVCLFPTRKACNDLNTEMLSYLTSEVRDIVCTDEVDETAGTRKWNKKASEHLEKLNNDSNMTAGLEARLSLAVGARVMLRRNIDTKIGLVNGAIGTVLSIAVNHVAVQFDHIVEPYNVEMVKSRFMVMRNFYVYRKQFPLILAYAVTIHKCQGLSLDCAIVDLSDRVFSAGMAYVALSRVRSLSGLYLTAFDPKSIMVSVSSLKEVNRLREAYRDDLPLYEMPPAKPGCKRKLTGSTEYDEPTAKKGRPRSGTKRKLIGTIKPKAKKTNEGKVKDPPSKSVHRKRKACVSENGKPAKNI